MTAGLLSLRGYQREAIDAVTAAWRRGMVRPAEVLFTGAGKTVIFSHLSVEWLAENPGRRVLIIVHTQELLDQALGKLRSVAPGLRVGAVQAQRNETLARVIVATVQTLRSPRRRAMIRDVGLIIVDECHHAVATSYREVLSHFGALGLAPGEGARAVCVGYTATMTRADDLALGDVWQDVVYTRTITDGISDGFLVRPRGVHVQVDDLDLSTVKTTRGDYREGDLGEAIEASMAPEAIAKAVTEHADDRKILLFAPTVSSATVIADALSASGRSVGLIHGALPQGERKAVLGDYRAGKTQILANCMVLCLDDKTEILTDTGWVGAEAMTKTHRVANWDQGRVYFEEPRQVIRRWLGEDERMYRLLTRGRDVRVTGGHRIIYRTSDALAWRKAPVEDLVGRSVQIPTVGWADPAPLAVETPSRPEVRARAISGVSYNLRKREGLSFEESKLEAERRITRRDNLRYLNPVELTEDQCRFIGFWIGDGSMNRLIRSGIEYTASQALVYPKIIEWFDGVIARCGLDVVRRVRPRDEAPHVWWSFPRGTGGGSQERSGVFSIEPYLDKDGSGLLWGLGEKQLDALLEGLWYADGNHGDGSTGYPPGWTISAKRKGLLDLLQAIGTVRGMNLTVRRGNLPTRNNHAQIWHLTRSSAIHHRTARHRFELDSKPWIPERVWCVQTSSKNIITRRNGTVTVMGNTEGFDEPAADCVVLARPTKSQGLYIQIAGRVLRPYPGKTDALILDVVGATRLHGLVAGIELFGLAPKTFDETSDDFEDADELDEGQQDVRQALGVDGPLVSTEVDLFAASSSRWLRTRAGVFFIPAGDRYIAVLPSPPSSPGAWMEHFAGRGGLYGYDVVTMHKHQLHTERAIVRAVPDLSYAMAWAEGDVTPAEKTTAAKDRSWQARPPTEKMRGLAQKLSIHVPAGARMGEVSNMITLALATKRIDAHLPAYLRGVQG